LSNLQADWQSAFPPPPPKQIITSNNVILDAGKEAQNGNPG
jgi:hypothetical protein